MDEPIDPAGNEPDPAPVRWHHTVDPVDGTRWKIDVGFLGSRWTCIWDRGCQGILDVPAAELGQGCCSVGAEMLDEDEAMRTAALAAMLSPERFQHHEAAAADGVLNGDRGATRVVDGACILLNRPGFGGGAGCALHIGALDDGDDPIDWKPSVCWQLPLKVVRDGDEATLRRWSRADWGSGGDTMAWCCPDESEPYVAETPVVVSLARELEALVGPEVLAHLTDELVTPD
jgi:hypothetical protein